MVIGSAYVVGKISWLLVYRCPEKVPLTGVGVGPGGVLPALSHQVGCDIELHLVESSFLHSAQSFLYVYSPGQNSSFQVSDHGRILLVLPLKVIALILFSTCCGRLDHHRLCYWQAFVLFELCLQGSRDPR